MTLNTSDLRNSFTSQLSQARSSFDLDEIKIKFFGKKGLVQQLMQDLKDRPAEERPLIGKMINDIKNEMLSCWQEKWESLTQEEKKIRWEKEGIDIHLPGRPLLTGFAHPIQKMMENILSILKELGFSVQYGPDVDSDYYNYEGLNFPKYHPARDMQDTYYINSEFLLRSHTSNTQLRVMENYKPPIRVAMPGTVYRNETISSRAHVFFHQVEGMYIDKDVSLADLLYTMDLFFKRLFDQDIKTRFRFSYFPFVEPGIEIDVSCISCQAKGCRLCKHSGWLEVAGAGMIHPEVLKNGGVDTEIYSGYAWGLGVERICMLKYGVDDIRDFTLNDLRFLSQFTSL
ncbi:MAG: phenylalanine--tRNA ligase subunit alpha [Rhabdochlamydiaceae bacterium]